jgi:hypothetical protein
MIAGTEYRPQWRKMPNLASCQQNTWWLMNGILQNSRPVSSNKNTVNSYANFTAALCQILKYENLAVSCNQWRGWGVLEALFTFIRHAQGVRFVRNTCGYREHITQYCTYSCQTKLLLCHDICDTPKSSAIWTNPNPWVWGRILGRS